MTKTHRTPDGLVGCPLRTKDGTPLRRYWCAACEGHLPSTMRSRAGDFDAMLAWWADHKVNPYHQRKLGSLTPEAFTSAAASTELAQRRKALARLATVKRDRKATA